MYLFDLNELPVEEGEQYPITYPKAEGLCLFLGLLSCLALLTTYPVHHKIQLC